MKADLKTLESFAFPQFEDHSGRVEIRAQELIRGEGESSLSTFSLTIRDGDSFITICPDRIRDTIVALKASAKVMEIHGVLSIAHLEEIFDA